MSEVLGIDVSLARGLDAAFVEGSRVVEVGRLAGPGALRDLLEARRPAAVGIDSPPRPGLELLRDPAEAVRLSVPPRPGTHLSRRVAEYELSRRGIGSHQTPGESGRLFSWMTAGFECFREAEGAGYPVFLGQGKPDGRSFEVFPYASYVALAGCLSPGRRFRVTWRRRVLEEAGVEGMAADLSIDALDAIAAAVTAQRFLAGAGSWVGDPREGVIVLPVPALQEGYRRCAPPNGPLHPSSPLAPRLCECGCGAPVRRRFLPGHDARLRSRLIAEARTGDEAHRELARLGWSHLMSKE